ncbi:MAG: SRPBCC family protein [Pyrinomonadaceae bacterium]
MFRIKADYKEQVEIKTTIERARAFFGEMRNFAELMPGIESITTEANGVMRWTIRADVPMLGAMRAAFAVQQTDDRPEKIEWSPAATEKSNFMRYAAVFEERGTRTLVRIAQHVEMRRQHARELHLLAGLAGEHRISLEMQKRVTEMIRTFLQRARTKLES